MAKAEKKIEEELSPIVTQSSSTALTELDAFEGEHGGAGVSSAAEDNVIPLIYVLQDNSKFVKQGRADYVQGATPGQLLLRNAPQPLVDGREGVPYQIAHKSKSFVEWVPRSAGGGLVEKHAMLITERDKDGKETLRLPDGRKVNKVPHPENPKRTILKLDNGNEIVETRQWIGFMLAGENPIPYALNIKGADHTIERALNSQMGQIINPKTKKPYSVFRHIVRIRTVPRQNPMGSWYGLEFIIERKANDDESLRGLQLFQAIERGEKQAAADYEDTSADATASPPHDGPRSMDD